MTAADIDTTEHSSDPYSTLKASRRMLSKSIVMNGPCTYLAAERERLSALRYRHVEVDQISSTIGGEIRGVNLADPLDDDVISEIRKALHDPPTRASPNSCASTRAPKPQATKTVGITTSRGAPSPRWAPCCMRSRCPPSGPTPCLPTCKPRTTDCPTMCVRVSTHSALSTISCAPSATI